MLRIRLQRVGTRNRPHFRIVVAERTAPVKGKFVEVLGAYRPDVKPKILSVNQERAKHWLSVGADPSDTVHNLFVNLGVLKKKRDIKYARQPKKKKEAQEAVAPAVAEATTPLASEASSQAPVVEAKEEVKKT